MIYISMLLSNCSPTPQNRTSMCRLSSCRQTVSSQCKPGRDSKAESDAVFTATCKSTLESNLGQSHTQHHQNTGTRPERDPPQVILQKVTVPRLKGSQHRLHLPAALQPSVQRVHGVLQTSEPVRRDCCFTSLFRQQQDKPCRRNV